MLVLKVTLRSLHGCLRDMTTHSAKCLAETNDTVTAAKRLKDAYSLEGKL